MTATRNSRFPATQAAVSYLDDFLASFTSSDNRFTFFVGAGLSVPVFPMWDELLLRMINKCDGKKVVSTADKNELLAALSQKKDFLDIASTCVEALPKHEYRAFIEEQFDHDIDITKLHAYQELFRLRPKTIVTTNFDVRVINYTPTPGHPQVADFIRLIGDALA